MLFHVMIHLIIFIPPVQSSRSAHVHAACSTHPNWSEMHTTHSAHFSPVQNLCCTHCATHSHSYSRESAMCSMGPEQAGVGTACSMRSRAVRGNTVSTGSNIGGVGRRVESRQEQFCGPVPEAGLAMCHSSGPWIRFDTTHPACVLYLELTQKTQY